MVSGQFDAPDGTGIKGGEYRVQIIGGDTDPITVMAEYLAEEVVKPLFPDTSLT